MRIVELEHRGLLENPRGAETCWMIRIALDLRRPTLVRLDDEAGRVTVQHHRGRVVHGDARRELGRLRDEW